MGLPDLLEVVPPRGLVQAEITVPGSKSITNRALILAALAGGETRLQGALWSEDTQVMVEALRQLGCEIDIISDHAEPANRTLVVRSASGELLPGGTPEKPLELFVGNAGTAARFLTALVCLGRGVYRLSGVPRMHERPQAALFEALRQLGYRIDSPTQKLPAFVHGDGSRSGSCEVSISESSQFASALLLCAKKGGWQVSVQGKNLDELPYVEMTRQLLARFPADGGEFRIEPDASSGSYFVAADWLLRPAGSAESVIQVRHWPASGWQIDGAFPQYLPLPTKVSRARDLGDSIMTAMSLAPFAGHPVRFTDLEPLRLQECERVAAVRTELGKCGVKVVEEGQSLIVYPSQVVGATIETYHDHRMAMCFAILGLKVSGIKIINPACVKKTFPNFFAKLAAPSPHGLGVTILDARTGQALAEQDLVAE